MSIASTVRRLGTFLRRSGQVKLTPKREYLKRKEIKVDSIGNLLSPIMVRRQKKGASFKSDNKPAVKAEFCGF